jgi:hypothetical protein
LENVATSKVAVYGDCDSDESGRLKNQLESFSLKDNINPFISSEFMIGVLFNALEAALYYDEEEKRHYMYSSTAGSYSCPLYCGSKPVQQRMDELLNHLVRQSPHLDDFYKTYPKFAPIAVEFEKSDKTNIKNTQEGRVPHLVERKHTMRAWALYYIGKKEEKSEDDSLIRGLMESTLMRIKDTLTRAFRNIGANAFLVETKTTKYMELFTIAVLESFKKILDRLRDSVKPLMPEPFRDRAAFDNFMESI